MKHTKLFQYNMKKWLSLFNGKIFQISKHSVWYHMYQKIHIMMVNYQIVPIIGYECKPLSTKYTIISYNVGLVAFFQEVHQNMP